MAARFIFPPAEKSARLTHELEDVASDLKKDHKFGVHRLRYDPAMPLPPVIDGVCDGHRLYIQSARDSRLLNWLNIWLYVIAIGFSGLALFVLTTDQDTTGFNWIPPFFFAVLATALFNSWRNSRRAYTKFIVFDRDSGLVLFPKTRKWPDFTVPFDKVEVITMTYIGRGGAHFMAKIIALARPKGMRGKRGEWFLPGHVNNERQALEQWCLISRFMDRSQPDPIPREAYVSWVDVKWFLDQGLSIDAMMKEKGEIRGDPEKEWFDYEGKLPRPPEEAYQRARADALGLTLEESYRIFGVEKEDVAKEEDSIRW